MLGIGAGAGLKLASLRPATRNLGEPSPVRTAPANPPVVLDDAVSHEPRLTEQQAIALAVNELSADEDGTLHLENPRHTVTYSSAAGVTFAPRFATLKWNWRLSHFGSAGRNWLNGERPQPRSAGFSLRTDAKAAQAEAYATTPAVEFDFGAFAEHYLAKADAIEQRFVLHEVPGALGDGEDLVIRGDIDCAGAFDDRFGAELGWVWRGETARDTVSLGQVTVFDAAGEILPAEMTATARGTQIVVDGGTLLAANYPVTVDPRIGTDYLVGSATAEERGSRHDDSAIAHDTAADQFMVVWLRGTELLDAPWQVMAQFVDGATGLVDGDAFAIASGAAEVRPDVAWDGDAFLVVWTADSGEGLGQRYTSNGATLGARFGVAPETVAELELSADPVNGGYVLFWVDRGGELMSRAITGDASVLTSPRALGIWPQGGFHLRLGSAVDSLRRHHCIATPDRVEDAGHRLVAQRVTAFGSPLAPVEVAPAADRLAATDVAFNPADREYCFAWTQAEAGTTMETGIEVEVHTRVCDEDLAPKGGVAVLTDVGPPGAFGLRMTVDPRVVHNAEASRYIVCWARHRQLGGGVFAAQLREGTGERAGTDLEVHPDGAGCSLGLAAHSGTDRLFAVITTSNDHGLLDYPLVGTSLRNFFGSFSVSDDRTAVFGTSEFLAGESETPAVAYLPAQRRHVVAWAQEHEAADDWQIFVRQVSDSGGAVGGAEIASDAPSAVDGFVLNTNRNPSIAGSGGASYLVAWDANVPLGFNGEKSEVFVRGWDGNAFDGAPLQISNAGSGTPGQLPSSREPDVAYNPGRDEYLVVWSSNGNGTSTLAGHDILTRTVRATGTVPGADTHQISTTMPGEVGAGSPAVAHNPDRGEYYVVWRGTSGDPAQTAPGEREIMGQRLDHLGRPTGTREVRISRTGPDFDVAFEAQSPDIAYGSAMERYCVVWSGATDSIFDNEIHARLVGSDGSLDGASFQVSDTSPEDDDSMFHWTAVQPSVAYQAAQGSFVVAWSADPIGFGIAPGEREIFAREISAVGVLGPQERVTAIGPDGDTAFYARGAAIAADGEGRYLIAYAANEDTAAITPDRSGIFVQRHAAPSSLRAWVTSVRPSLSLGQVQIRWEATPGTAFRLQSSTDLQTWTDLTDTIIVEGASTVASEVIDAIAERKFYRARVIGAE